MQSSVNHDGPSGSRFSVPSVHARPAVAASVGVSALLAVAVATVLPPRARLFAAPAMPQPAAPTRMPAVARPPAYSAPANEPRAERFTGKVGPDLSASLTAAGVPELQGRQYVALLARAIPLAGGLSVEDRFDLIVERKPGGALGQLLYVGLDRVARSDVELLKWTDGKQLIWVNADGVGGVDSSGISLPVQGRMTSRFGNRFHPILGYERFHAGVDLAAAAGTPIRAAADGRVLAAGWRGGYGQEVELAHGAGLDTRYGHMSRIAARIGTVVHKGEVIGWVGSTGLSTGPHVHFEVTRNGRPVNPLSVKMASGPGHLEGEKLHQFDDVLRGLLLSSGQGN